MKIELFFDEMCFGEVLPLPEVLCNGLDDNCDGEIEDDMEDTDTLSLRSDRDSNTHRYIKRN